MGPYHPRLDILSNPSKKNLAMDQTTKFCNAEISKAPRHTTPALLSFPGLLTMMKKWNNLPQKNENVKTKSGLQILQICWPC